MLEGRVRADTGLGGGAEGVKGAAEEGLSGHLDLNDDSDDGVDE